MSERAVELLQIELGRLIEANKAEIARLTLLREKLAVVELSIDGRERQMVDLREAIEALS